MPKRSANKVEEYLDRESKCVDDVSESSDESEEDIASVEIKKKKSSKRVNKNKKNKTQGKIILY